jgi:hypothetical protein
MLHFQNCGRANLVVIPSPDYARDIAERDIIGIDTKNVLLI